MELIKVGVQTYYIKNRTNIGIYKINENEVYVIDTGNDKDAGKKIIKIIDEEGWTIKGIINTHSNADHIGGNKVIQDRTGAVALAKSSERAFIEYPYPEPSFLFGGYPFKDLRNKFLEAQGSHAIKIDEALPDGLVYFSLKGHYFDMIGIKTSDNVYFLGDSIFSEETITKYHIFFIYDVKEFLNTLDYLSTLDGYFIPSHCDASSDIKELININRNKVFEIINKICDICISRKTFEEILKHMFDEYSLEMNANQYVLVGSTIKSYLSYLYDEEKLIYEFEDNKMFWKSTK